MWNISYLIDKFPWWWDFVVLVSLLFFGIGIKRFFSRPVDDILIIVLSLVCWMFFGLNIVLSILAIIALCVTDITVNLRTTKKVD